MGKKNEITYESKTVLGYLYREVLEKIKGVKKDYKEKETYINSKMYFDE